MLFQEITFRNLLSFGPDSSPMPWRPLNVLIGPNGSGKSNVLAGIDLLRSTPNQFGAPMRGTGGITEWIWKGDAQGAATITARLHNSLRVTPLSHEIQFAAGPSGFAVYNEEIRDVESAVLASTSPHYVRENGRAELTNRSGHMIPLTDSNSPAPDRSVLSEIRDPIQYPALHAIATSYQRVRLYREWSFGPAAIFRRPQPADARGDILAEDFSNLGLFLNHLRGKPEAKRQILHYLRDLYAGLDDFDVSVRGGTVEVFLTEGSFNIPAGRLSDGTLRYLSLLAILCDPEPPPLIGIEEPELGLHPDLVPKIADLLVEASERTQIIVTTHSDLLVDAMTERPEAVVVVEKNDGKTQAKRLEANEELKEYLKTYRLGELWLRGFVGGTRW